ncbi:MAG: hypothetical protein H0T89_07355 [Deltaproteobacteria bacterium]|nr:hypothetical protein [Deltaproteobacteria bacterium]
MRVALIACVAALAACGNRASQPAARDDAAAPRDVAVVVDVPARPLGLPDLDGYGWRKRGGHPAFRVARTAEHREDWPTVVTMCRQALAADPGHLEAAWLLAAALGKQGKHDELLVPLHLAVGGDFGKWGQASLELPALRSFLATQTGQAWRRRVEQDRSLYLAALAQAVVVTAVGDLYAFDPEAARWHRLTRTYGLVIGALRVPATNRIVYVTRQRAKLPKERRLAVGIVDLARGRTARPVDLTSGGLASPGLAAIGPVTISYAQKANPGVWIGAPVKRSPAVAGSLHLGRSRTLAWHRVDDENKLVALPPKTVRPSGPWLEIAATQAAGAVRLHGLPLANVTADWDEHGFASAIRIGKSNRVIAVPSPGVIDGNSATWSADRARLAFVARLSEECVPDAINSAAFVAAPATGQLQELERAADGLAVEWVGDRKLAIAGDRGVSIVDLDGARPVLLAGAEGLVTPRQRPACTQPDPEPTVSTDPPEPDLADPGISEVGPGEPSDAGVVDAR